VSIGTDNVRRWWAEGRALSLDDAVALAQTELTQDSPSVAASDRAASLTPRQLEVAVLVAQGLTNRQIATRLVVTERAVAAHIERILNRLGVGSRTQIAVWVSERGLVSERTG
jgi:DNA-binding NarL/FixJ family response regulator